ACGHEFIVGSTQKEIRLDICSKCHPFFTGKQKFVDTAGRVDKYFRKYGDEAQRKFKKKKKKLKLTEEELAREFELAESDEAAVDEAPEAEAVAEVSAPVAEASAVVEAAPEQAPEAPAEPAAESKEG
ncbi:MAG: 50S ribosomal protein L31, partial [bacterium]